MDLSQEWLLLNLTAPYNGIAWGLIAAFGAIFYGMSIVIFCRALTIFWERGLGSRATKLTFCACVFGFALLTALTAGLFTSSTVFSSAIIQLSRGKDAETVLDLMNKEYIHIDVASAFPDALLIVFSDAVIVWRTMVLFPDKKWLKIFLLFCWTGAFAALLSDVVFVETSSHLFDWLLGANGPLYVTNEIAFYFSILENVVATSAISYRLWKHGKYMAKTLNIKSQAQEVMMLLLETGLLFCICQIVLRVFVNLLLRDIIARGSTVGIFLSIMPGWVIYYFAGNYVAIIYIIVNKKKSLSRSYVENISLAIHMDGASS